MTELESAQSADGSLNLSVLFGLPLLNSIFHEVLRLYTDVLVSRTLEKDHTLPISSLGDRKVLLRKGTLAFAPAWPGQRDPDAWNGDKPANVFYAERFLTTDLETGKDVFTTSGTAGRFFPFGGGKSICPGRVFARQEIIAATAMVLLAFEVELAGFVDGKGKASESFPSLRDGFGGSGIILQEGDLRIRVKRKTKR
jgi:cytochrome P450